VLFDLDGTLVDSVYQHVPQKSLTTPPDEVPRIAEKVRAQIYREIEGETGKKAS